MTQTSPKIVPAVNKISSACVVRLGNCDFSMRAPVCRPNFSKTNRNRCIEKKRQLSLISPNTRPHKSKNQVNYRVWTPILLHNFLETYPRLMSQSSHVNPQLNLYTKRAMRQLKSRPDLTLFKELDYLVPPRDWLMKGNLTSVNFAAEISLITDNLVAMCRKLIKKVWKCPKSLSK